MATEEQKILGKLYELEDSIKPSLLKKEKYEELSYLENIIRKYEDIIINDQVKTIGI